MKKSGGSTVKPGFYWNTKKWELVPVSDKPGKLPGEGDQSYVRVPTTVMLLLAPVMGGAFVVFMPFIGFYMLGQQLVKKGVRALGGAHETPAAAHKRV